MKDGVGVRDENGDRGEMGRGLGMRVKMEGGKGMGIAAEDGPGTRLGWSWRWDRDAGESGPMDEAWNWDSEWE